MINRMNRVNGRLEEDTSPLASAVRYDADQVRSEEEKAQARANMGAISEAQLADTKADLEEQIENISAISDPETVSQMVEDVAKHETDISALKSNLNSVVGYKTNYVFANNEVTATSGYVARITNGHCDYIENPSGFWKSLLLPVNCLYIDGVATLKSGGLSGNESVGIPSFAFIDENYNVVGTPIYGAISAPHTFNQSDVPFDAVYVVCDYAESFTFAFHSLALQLKDISDVTNAGIVEDKTSEIELTWENATGYYDRYGSFFEYSGITTETLDVNEGEKYIYNGSNFYQSAVLVYFDANNNYLSSVWFGDNANKLNNVSIIVPTGAFKMMIQRAFDAQISIEKVIGLKAKAVNSVLKNKRITVIGDSITEKNLRAATNWADYIANWCGAIIQNLGASGTGFIAGGANPYSNRINSINNPDIIGIALSFNDMSNSVADLTTAAETFFDSLITAYPAKPIICYVQGPWSAYHYGVQASDDWVNALKEVCNKRGIPFYDDLYKGGTLKPWIAGNRAVYYINDGEGSTGEEDYVHPNSEGHKAIARYLYTKFAENIVDSGLDYTNSN